MPYLETIFLTCVYKSLWVKNFCYFQSLSFSYLNLKREFEHFYYSFSFFLLFGMFSWKPNKNWSTCWACTLQKVNMEPYFLVNFDRQFVQSFCIEIACRNSQYFFFFDKNHIGKNNVLHNDLIASSKKIRNQNRFLIIDLQFSLVVSRDISTTFIATFPPLLPLLYPQLTQNSAKVDSLELELRS
jgi:hypothetical protein